MPRAPEPHLPLSKQLTGRTLANVSNIWKGCQRGNVCTSAHSRDELGKQRQALANSELHKRYLCKHFKNNRTWESALVTAADVATWGKHKPLCVASHVRCNTHVIHATVQLYTIMI